MTEVLLHSAEAVTQAANLLTQNEVVALPTETVYGLAGNAFEPQAIQKIFAAKERPSFDPLIVHVSERYLKDSRRLVPALVQDGILAPEILLAPELAKIHDLVKKFWPGPLTIILPRGPKIPDAVTSSQPTVGIRCPAHPVFQAVLSKIAFPLAAPSANRFGRISPTEAAHVLSELSGRIPMILDGGACEVGVESTIIKIDFPFAVSLLRPGKISASELETALQTKLTRGETLGETHATKNAVTPGSLDEHYAPTKPLYLMPGSFENFASTQEFLNDVGAPEKIALLAMSDFAPELKSNAVSIRTLSSQKSIEEVAQNLFRIMRELDQDHTIDAIVADLPFGHHEGLGAAVADRLKRASRNKPVF